MNVLPTFIFASTVLISACSSAPPVHGNVETPVAAASAKHKYRCQSGQSIVAAYPAADTATIKYKGISYDMKIAVSASGARYVGGGLEWWTKGSGAGSEGTLFRHLADGRSGSIIETCKAS
jgi:membrane-bound inhibitor of C-type lysozyme